MPTFFRKNELTEEQKKNWDNAIVSYSKVLEFNALQSLQKMTDSDKSDYMKDKENFTDEDILKKILQGCQIMGNPPGHEKSSLFYRLLSGKKVLKNPPPTSYSYPDYDIVESNGKRELMFESDNMDELVKQTSSYTDYPHILINQSAWKVINIISPQKVVVTHHRLEKEGFTWEVELTEITAEESKSALLCSYDPSIPKLTTYNSLLKECLHQAQQHFYLLKIASNQEEYKKYEEKQLSKYPKEKVEVGFISEWMKKQLKQTLENAQNMLAERLAKGLPIEPTQEEILEYAKNTEKQYLGNEYFEKDGVLYKKAWMMKRTFPLVLTDEYYLNF